MFDNEHMAGTTFIAAGNWVPLMDYAMRKGISLSTLRRHIKANKITFKVEEGRYLLWFEDEKNEPVQTRKSEDDQIPALRNHLAELSIELKKAHEEIAELKTLIALYEEKIPPHRFNN